MVGFGIEMIGYNCPNQPLLLGAEWVVFGNRAAAEMTAQLLSATTCEDYRVIDLEGAKKPPVQVAIDSLVARLTEEYVR